jgi:hypothetical protein
MNINIILKKLGNHWYPSINHDDFQEIVLDSKIEKVLSFFDKNKTGQLNITFTKCNSVINNVSFFKDEDVTRYYITNDNFDLTCYILNHSFKVSSYLYCLLEREFDFDFHETLYNIKISNYEV